MAVYQLGGDDKVKFARVEKDIQQRHTCILSFLDFR